MSSFIRYYLRNVHFWVIAVLCIGLFIFYRFWPWRYLLLDNQFWQIFPFFEDLAIVELKYKVLGSLFFIPIFYAIITSGWRRALVVWAICLVLALPSILATWQSPENLSINLLYFLIPICITSLVYLELEWRSRVKKEYVERERERNMYLSRIIEAQENERGRIAREIHDDTVQNLIALANQLEGVSSSQTESVREMNGIVLELKSILSGIKDPSFASEDLFRSVGIIEAMGEAAHNRIEEISFSRDLVLSTVNNLRNICTNLRPATLDRLGLIPALRMLVGTMNKDYAIDTAISVCGEQYKLPPQIETALYRVVQEALTNVGHHSRAAHASVSLQFRPNELEITVQDDGRGFDIVEAMQSIVSDNKFGLTGMRERIRLVNGTLDIQSDKWAGTALTIKLPVPDAA
jgi:two-component system, NarL family, sensor histidine kinase DegS